MKSHLFAALGLFALAVLPACGDDDDDQATTGTTTEATTTGTTTTTTTTTTDGTTTTTTTTTTDGTTTMVDTGTTGAMDTAMIRVIHLGVNAPAVDVYANSEGPIVEALEFRNGTPYSEVAADDYTFQITVSGDPPEDAVLTPMLTLEPDTMYTAAAIGDLDETNGAPGLQAIALVDDAEGIDPANVRITVVHAAPALGQVDVYEITDPNNPMTLLEDVDFAASTTLPDIPAGPLEIGVDVDDDMTSDVTFSVDSTALAGSQLNVYANTDADGNAVLIAQLPDGTLLPIAPN